MTPSFPPLDNVSIAQYGTAAQYQLVPISKIELSKLNIATIHSICNEPEIYEWLFSPTQYTVEKAKGFLVSGKKGWEEGTHFVFLLLDPQGSIAGAIDIKSAKVDAGEIGYWVSKAHTGIATAAVEKVVQIARTAGYSTVFAQTKAGNQRSINVLLRNGFRENPAYRRNEACDRAFCLPLS